MIQIQNYSFGYKDTPVLENVNLTVPSGQITAIIGANGAGKSTLLKSVTGLVQGTGGSITVQSANLQKLSRLERAKIISVFEIVLLGMVGNLSTRVDADDIERAHAALELFKLERFAKRNIAELSGGQRQMVFIAQALVKEPKILVFDEPTASLDLCRQYELMNKLQELTRTRGLTTLLTLHHLELVAHYADQVVAMHDKAIYACGKSSEVMTEAMFRDVFRIETEVFTDKRGTIRVLPISPVASACCAPEPATALA